uniref:Odorant receptor n=1 Tax=Cephus cinctus TaxID=211228 RepID=A0A1W6L1C5_CEPCN|nr:odorant receptor 1 [Cephus cinctus]
MYLTIDSDILWLSKRVLSLAGIWPESPNNFRFFIYLLYLSLFNCAEFAALVLNLYWMNFDKSVRNMTESIPTAMVILKTAMFRRNMQLLLPLLSEVRADKFSVEEEPGIAWLYNIMGKLYTRLSVVLIFIVTTMLYAVPLSQWIVAKSNNLTSTYELPYQMYFGFEINDLRSHVLACLSLLPMSTVLTIGCTGSDTLLVVLIFYLCRQFVLLSVRIRNVETDPLIHPTKMKQLIERHANLIGMATALNKTYSSLLLVQTMGLSFVICIVAFELLTMAEVGEETNTLSFIIYSLAVVTLLFSYCFLGECLIHESSSIHNACYFSNWYRLPPDLARPIIIPIMRSRKPLHLTAGQFYVFSLETFTSHRIVHMSLDLQLHGIYRKDRLDPTGFYYNIE